MATKKTKKPASKSTKATKAPAKAKAPPRERLAAFFRKLYKQPKLMQKFTESAASRKEVLANTDLTPQHQDLLATGCVRDMIGALSGAAPSDNTTISCLDDDGEAALCNHPDCNAFRAATKPG
jgi:hypothetical protein